MRNTIMIGLLGTLVWASASVAQESEKTPEAVILERLKEARGDIPFGEVSPSPIDGLYQVRIPGGQVLYVSPEGDKIIVGDLLAVGPNGFTPVEDPKLVERREQALEELDGTEAISFKPEGETKAVVYVFTDVDCGYCRKLHSQLDGYQENGETQPGYLDLGIEIRYLAYPRAGVPSGSSDKMVSAWCAKDQQKAIDRLKNLQSIEPQQCENNPVAAHFQLGGEVGVRGTPALLLPDGRLVSGYQPPAQLAQTLGI